MKVVQLGCGVTGLVCAEHLEKHPKVDEIVLADKQIGPAESFVERAGNEKTSLQKADASKPSDLKKLLKDCDLLISSVPSEMNPKMLDVALALGVDYADFTIPLETIPKFDDIQRSCENAGITALTAMGSDPGISDVFAMIGASKLDAVHEIHIKDADNAISPDHDVFTLWCPHDMLEEVTMNAAVYESGEIKWLPPLSRSEVYGFPDPIGSHRIFNTTHEETFLLPRFLRDVRYVDFMIVVPDKLAEFANMIRKMGLHSMQPVRVDGMEVKPLDVVAACMPDPVRLVEKIKGSAGIIVEVVGLKDGERRMVKTWIAMTHEEAFAKYKTSATGYMVGTGAAIGVEMLVSGDIRKSGFFIPEMLNHRRFVDKMHEKGLEVHQIACAV
ncbi:MAG: saccharopine dehydrogenase NADP-binding domain-containing protein [Candidatus Thermoplasmatota archaeon]|nr:saccharopine dehydrogenase NADP-binding domain-containing protein [Candidatus Thermoplasmatota archaeon]